MTIPFKSHPVEFNQHLLFPSNIFDLLADDHECYLYSDLFQQLNTAQLKAITKSTAKTLTTQNKLFPS